MRYLHAKYLVRRFGLVLIGCTPKQARNIFMPYMCGFAYGDLGIGEDLRTAVACCEAANIPHHAVNVDAGNIRQVDQLLKG